MNVEFKKLLKKYGFLCLILFVLFLLMTLSTVLTRKSWTLGLREQIQDTLHLSYPAEEIIVGNAIQIEQPISVSSAAYELSFADENTGYAVLVRITGIAGPVAVLYMRRPGEYEFSYVGILNDNQTYDDSFPWLGVSYRQIDYWKNRIPQIIGEVR